MMFEYPRTVNLTVAILWSGISSTLETILKSNFYPVTTFFKVRDRQTDRQRAGHIATRDTTPLRYNENDARIHVAKRG